MTWIWPWLVLAALCLLLALYILRYALALRPQGGSLDWIARYDVQPLRLKGCLHCCTGRDLLALLPALVAAALCYAAAWTADSALQLSWTICAGGTALGVYLLARRTLGSTEVALLSASICALDLSSSPALSLAAVWSFCFLAEWIHTERGWSILLLAAALALTTAGCILHPGLLCLLGVEVLLVLLVLPLRWRTSSYRLAWALGTLVLLCLLIAGLAVGLTVAIAWLEGDLQHITVQTLLRWVRSVDWRLYLPLSLQENPLLQLAALPAAVACWHGLFRRHRAEGLLLGTGYLAALLTAVFAGLAILPPFAALCWAYTWRDLHAAGAKGVARVMALVSAALSVLSVLPLFGML